MKQLISMFALLITFSACSPEMNFKPKQYQAGKQRTFSNSFSEVYDASLLAMSSNGLNIAERQSLNGIKYIISSGNNVAIMITVEPIGTKTRIWLNERKQFKLKNGDSNKMTDVLIDLITIRLRS